MTCLMKHVFSGGYCNVAPWGNGGIQGWKGSPGHQLRKVLEFDHSPK